MTIITSKAMRERVLSQFDRAAAEVVEWQNVIGVEGNRRLLGLIIAQAPGSVAELAELAGRAQSNVSRSLVALVRSGLVDLRQNGRVSVPTATSLGLEKAAALNLAQMEVTSTTPSAPLPEGVDTSVISTIFDEAIAGSQEVQGSVIVALPVRGEPKPLSAKGHTNLTSLAERWLVDWWRMLYRRDASYRLCDLSAIRAGSRSELTLLVKSHGKRVELAARVRGFGEMSLTKEKAFIPLWDFQKALRDGVLNPIADQLSRNGEVDRLLHGLLSRLDAIEENPRDRDFSRTAGALNLPHDTLNDTMSDAISRLIDTISDEEARLEFASSLVFDEMVEGTSWIEREMAQNGERNRLVELDTIAAACRSSINTAGLRPYARGLELAKRVRAHLRLAADSSVGGLTGLADTAGAPDFECSGAAPGDLLGFQNRLRDAPSVVVNGDGGDSSSFLLGRAIGDYIAFECEEACISDIYTDRQAVNRAFAAELIAPSEAVVSMIDEGASRKQVALHFGTSQTVIRHQFENNADRHGHRQWRA